MKKSILVGAFAATVAFGIPFSQADRGTVGGGGVPPAPQHCPITSSFKYSCVIELHDGDGSDGFIFADVTQNSLKPAAYTSQSSGDLASGTWERAFDSNMAPPLPSQISGTHVYFTLPTSCVNPYGMQNVVALSASVKDGDQTFSFEGRGDLSTKKDIVLKGSIQQDSINASDFSSLSISVQCSRIE